MGGARVLKAGKDAELWPRRRLSAAEWMNAERAEALIASAEAEAEAVRRSAAEVRGAAREEGRAEGRAEGRREVEARLAARLADLAEAQARWQARAEVEALDLAVEMARRLVGRELRCDPSAVAEGAVAALRAAGTRRTLRVRLHPDSVAHVRQVVGAASGAGGAALELVSDPALLPGDVLVETEAGQVDARIASRLEGFRSALGREAA